jgi:3-oxoacyl-[acyl-carrier protein] reductase
MSSDVERATATDALSKPPTLRDKTCVVTGGSRGIGRAIATDLARHGARVVVNYHSSPAEATTVLDDIEPTDGTGISVQADVSTPDDVGSMVSGVHDEFGPVDVLVNNAGITIDKRFPDLTQEDWRRVIRVNLEGAFHVTQAFYEDIVEAEEGRIINISSVNANQGSYGQTNYSASKSGLVGFTRSLSVELARSGSTANVVAPGYTETDMVEGLRDDIKEKIQKNIPLRRFADPAEIAGVVRFLASDDASYITGEVINVNGGMHP